MPWSEMHRAFTIDEYLRNGKSIMLTKQAFRTRFDLGPNDTVPGGKTIRRWVLNNREIDRKFQKRARARTIRTPKYIRATKQSLQQFPKLSAKKRAAVLGISLRSLERILHDISK
ncbi:hypothetical protein GWI33_020198 [Rhynchophorus ferrugineus]|uniref:DUF4817 domain-containing protein n=1 Tax=Rhynchophorus ferrugineus TaxID=354439 RepID=A0A834I3W5_RHYFE|nr:hypothetical protein GWI33_020198 [Rhynchophorus ferrugineus]